MKILVTGATGYIGSHLVKALYDLGHDVVGTDKHELNQIQDLTSNFFYWDIREKNPTVAYYDKVVHLAAETKVHQSMLTPYQYYETNIIGTKNVIDHAKCKHFIYCSTGSAFQPESSPYSSSKFGGEVVTSQYCKQHSIIRFYNVSGNDGYQKFDEVTHLIRKAAKVANNIRYQMNNPEYNHINVYGVDYNTRDGTAIRNYTHIKDIINGIVNILHSEPTIGPNLECLGSEKGFTVREVIDTMKKVSGVDFEVKDMDRRAGDLPVSVIPKASRHFEERYTLEDMCKDALEHEKLLEGIQ